MAASPGAPGSDALGGGEREAHDSVGIGSEGPRSPDDSDRDDCDGSGGDQQWKHTPPDGRGACSGVDRICLERSLEHEAHGSDIRNPLAERLPQAQTQCLTH